MGVFPPKPADGDSTPPTPVAGLVIEIAGTDRTSYYMQKSLGITESLGSRSTCNFKIFDSAGTLSIVIGSSLLVTIDEVVVFSGTIESTDKNFPSMDYSDTGMFIQVRAVDHNQIPDRKLVSRTFEVEDQTFGDIVKVLLAEYLADEGVVAGQIQNGASANLITVNYETVTSVLNMLADAVGFVWYIDYNKRLFFRDRIDVEAPFSLSSSNPNYRRLTVKETRSEYRNRQFLRGGLEVSPNFRIEEFGGNNIDRTFETSLPIGAQPEIYVNRGAGQNAGTWVQEVVGLDSTVTSSFGTPAVWSWQPGERSVTQDGDQDILSQYGTDLSPEDTSWLLERGFDIIPQFIVSDRLRVVYRPLVRILAQAQDDAEIASRAAVEGGTGIYEALAEDERIEDSSFAQARASGFISKYGRIPKIAQIQTDTAGLRAGQLQTINLSKEGLPNASYLIEKISARDRGDGVLKYSYTALDGESLGGWQEFFRRLIQKGRKFIITEGEVVMTFPVGQDSLTLTDNVPTPDTSNTLGAYTTDAYTVCLVDGGSQVGVSIYSGAGYERRVKDASPLAYYRMNEFAGSGFEGVTLSDASGSGNAGTAFRLQFGSPGAVGENPVWTTEGGAFFLPNGQFNHRFRTIAAENVLNPSASIAFPAIADTDIHGAPRIVLPGSILNGESNLTIECFIRPPQSNANEMTLLNAGSSGDFSNLRITVDANGTPTVAGTDSISLYYFDDSAGATRQVKWSGLTLRAGQPMADPHSFRVVGLDFTHIAITRDQFSDAFELYVDGQSNGIKVTNESGDRVDLTNLSVDDGGFVIGQAFNSSFTVFTASKNYQGYIDELAIFDSILTQPVIITHAEDKPVSYHVGSRLPPGSILRGVEDIRTGVTHPEQPTFIDL